MQTNRSQEARMGGPGGQRKGEEKVTEEASSLIQWGRMTFERQEGR